MSKKTFDFSQYLIPFPSQERVAQPKYSDAEKIELIAQNFAGIMEILGLDLEDDSLKKTPIRVAKMYVEQIFSGLDPARFPKTNLIPNPSSDSTQVVQVNVAFTSFCEHHFVPMSGQATVAYIPGESLIGLSAISSIVHYFAKRPQLQERLTSQIGNALAKLLEIEDVAVYIQAKHFCVLARSQEASACGNMATHCLGGRFKTDENLRREFFELRSSLE